MRVVLLAAAAASTVSAQTATSTASQAVWMALEDGTERRGTTGWYHFECSLNLKALCDATPANCADKAKKAAQCTLAVQYCDSAAGVAASAEDDCAGKTTESACTGNCAWQKPCMNDLYVNYTSEDVVCVSGAELAFGYDERSYEITPQECKGKSAGDDTACAANGADLTACANAPLCEVKAGTPQTIPFYNSGLYSGRHPAHTGFVGPKKGYGVNDLPAAVIGGMPTPDVAFAENGEVIPAKTEFPHGYDCKGDRLEIMYYQDASCAGEPSTLIEPNPVTLNAAKGSSFCTIQRVNRYIPGDPFKTTIAVPYYQYFKFLGGAATKAWHRGESFHSCAHAMDPTNNGGMQRATNSHFDRWAKGICTTNTTAPVSARALRTTSEGALEETLEADTLPKSESRRRLDRARGLLAQMPATYRNSPVLRSAIAALTGAPVLRERADAQTRRLAVTPTAPMLKGAVTFDKGWGQFERVRVDANDVNDGICAFPPSKFANETLSVVSELSEAGIEARDALLGAAMSGAVYNAVGLVAAGVFAALAF